MATCNCEKPLDIQIDMQLLLQPLKEKQLISSAHFWGIEKDENGEKQPNQTKIHKYYSFFNLSTGTQFQTLPSLIPHGWFIIHSPKKCTKLCYLILYLNKPHTCSSKTLEGKPQSFPLVTFVYKQCKEAQYYPTDTNFTHVNSPLKFQKITLQSQALHRVREGLTYHLACPFK